MKILLATDGSPCSETAIDEVARRPWPADTQVRVVSIVETPAPLVAEPQLMASGYFVEAEKICRRQAEDAVKLAAAKLAGVQPGSTDLARAVRPALEAHGIKFLTDFPIREITAGHLLSDDGLKLEYDLLMLVPPFQGASAMADTGLTNQNGYVRVDQTMHVCDTERMYAVGDAVYFSGPKMGHMAVRQAEVAADNLAAELEGRAADAVYEHEMMLVVDEGGKDSLYFHKNLCASACRWTTSKTYAIGRASSPTADMKRSANPQNARVR